MLTCTNMMSFNAPAKFFRSLDVYTLAYLWWLICAILLLFWFCRCEIMIIFVFSPRNNDKTTRNNEINKALINQCHKIFCPAIYRLLALQFIVFWLRNHDESRCVETKSKKTQFYVFSLFLGEVEKKNCIFLFSFLRFRLRHKITKNFIISVRHFDFAPQYRSLSLFRGEQTINCGAKK